MDGKALTKAPSSLDDYIASQGRGLVTPLSIQGSPWAPDTTDYTDVWKTLTNNNLAGAPNRAPTREELNVARQIKQGYTDAFDWRTHEYTTTPTPFSIMGSSGGMSNFESSPVDQFGWVKYPEGSPYGAYNLRNNYTVPVGTEITASTVGTPPPEEESGWLSNPITSFLYKGARETGRVVGQNPFIVPLAFAGGAGALTGAFSGAGAGAASGAGAGATGAGAAGAAAGAAAQGGVLYGTGTAAAAAYASAAAAAVQAGLSAAEVTAAATAAGNAAAGAGAGATFTPEELALASNGASFTSGVEGMNTAGLGTIGSGAPSTTPGLGSRLLSSGKSLGKKLLTQVALNALMGKGGGGTSGDETGLTASPTTEAIRRRMIEENRFKFNQQMVGLSNRDVPYTRR